ncbi:MAG: hypothetical protein JXA25_10050 [Anaerolineales bacterium]|nr:hypothetical protein [Anaerolineales bacterium]
MPLLLGLDIGTTSVKAGIFSDTGLEHGVIRVDYDLQTPLIDHVEIDAELYWRAVCEAVGRVLNENTIPADEVLAIAVSSQGETIIPVDKDGRPLFPALVWLDHRARREAVMLSEALGSEVYHRTGIPDINPSWPACKILWLKRNYTALFRSTYRFMLVQDFIVQRLTGRFVTEGSIACTSLLYDITSHTWWDDALRAVGLPEDKLPELSTPGADAGVLTRQSAAALGLPQGIPVVLGGMDQAAGAVGAGNIHSEMVSETTGGALAIQVTVENPGLDQTGRIPVYVHSAPDRYLFVPVCDTGGMALKWLRDTFHAEKMEEAQRIGKSSYDILTEAAAKITPGCDGLLMLPHLSGAFSPEYNPDARGVFFGFSLYHRTDHFTRAVLEAVAFMMRRNLELVAVCGINAREIRSTGGGAASRLWRQIKADVCNLPVLTLRSHDTALLGDAVLAAAAIGCYASVEEAAAAMVRTEDRLEPIPANAAVYEQAYRNYCQLNDVLDPVFRQQYGGTDHGQG